MVGAAVVAVDVGTGSARAGVFGPDGRMLGRAEQPIALHRPMADHAEQSSEDIWSAVAKSVREARASAGVAAEEVAGLSFDATCSLVALDREDRPASVSTTGEDRWNVVVWFDRSAGRGRVRGAVPGLRCIEPDDRLDRHCRRRLHLLVGRHA
jgi:ribulose kinase